MVSSKDWPDAPLTTVRVAKLLLTLSSAVVSANDEAVRAFRTG